MVSFRSAMPSIPRSSRNIDWNQNADFFRFTRGRFVSGEAEQMSQRHLKFNMNELCQVAGDAVGKSCVKVEKCADGMYNKAFVLTMDNNEQVVAKVPNPNAGLPHLTTASEVATMEFARNVLNTPAPRVLAWCSNDKTKVEAEYIIMEKAQGVQLQTVWADLSFWQKGQIVKSLARYQRAWMKASFNRIGSLYFAADLQSSPDAIPCYRNENPDRDATDTQFVVGPITGREWVDLGRASLKCDRGPWLSVECYRQAMVERDLQAVRSISPLPNPLTLLCGPGLYQPTQTKKIRAGNAALKVLPRVLPKNIFVNPNNPAEILSVIDWQSTFIAPLFDHNVIPGYLSYDGPPVRGIEKPSLPELPENTMPEEEALAEKLYHEQSLVYGFKLLLQNNISSAYEAIQYGESEQSDVLYTSRRLFDIGEAHCMAAVAAIESLDTFSETELAEIDADVQKTSASIHVMNVIKKALGPLFPDKGVIAHNQYEDAKAALETVKRQIITDFSSSPEDRMAWEQAWPFDP